MFSTVNKVDGLTLPIFETRRALIIVNLQNDSFYQQGDMYITKNRDFVPRLKAMIPYFRKHGDIVWAHTHLGVLPSQPSSETANIEANADKLAEMNREEQTVKEQQIKTQHLSDEERERMKDLEPMDPDPNVTPGYQEYWSTSREKQAMESASASTRREKRSADWQASFTDKDNLIEERLSKPRKGQRTRFYIAGTKGAEILNDLLDVYDYDKDLVVTKHHYSAFDQTSLLVALRTKLVTEVYICGCLTNVGVYSTAADAVQHGLQVTVVEDCLGYRNEDKHDEALRQMADIMGANGITSEEIIEETGGLDLPGDLGDLNLQVSEKPQVYDRTKASPNADDSTTVQRKSRGRGSWAMSKSQHLGPSDKIGSASKS